MEEAPVILTERLKLRPATECDLQFILELRSNAEVNKYVNRSIPETISDARDFFERINREHAMGKTYYWLLEKSEDQQLVGAVCLWNINRDKHEGELGYELLPEYWKKGYMKEAITGCLQFGKEIGLRDICAFTHRDNASSLNLLKSLNFIFQPGRIDTEVKENLCYTLGLGP